MLQANLPVLTSLRNHDGALARRLAVAGGRDWREVDRAEKARVAALGERLGRATARPTFAGQGEVLGQQIDRVRERRAER